MEVGEFNLESSIYESGGSKCNPNFKSAIRGAEL